MNSTLKIILGVVSVLIITGVGYYAFNTQVTAPEDQSLTENQTLGLKKEIQPTGNIDASVAAILAEADSEKTLIDEEDTDNDIMVSDTAAINELGRSYDETGL
jgi:hypothetical protein